MKHPAIAKITPNAAAQIAKKLSVPRERPSKPTHTPRMPNLTPFMIIRICFP